ncbi:MAG: hypothetical protein KAJ23_18540 [Maribacter sp.]|nr:hypothetical protein [Maribacter sp.]
MKWYKIVVWVFVAFIGLFFIFAVWYKYEYSMEMVQPYEINTPDLGSTLLIATQGSIFKDAVTEGIINHYKSDSIFIKVIDVSSLENADTSNFDAMLILHTWEYGKPPEILQSFIDKNSAIKNKIVVLATSGEGSEKMENVDAIAGESLVKDVPFYTDKIIQKLDRLFNSNN